ncbi:hypothetical protein L1987_62111 [Smallanthus sonchifolius]|uniref:Uncharacterized protein n=1 Tax=Smallanthus sonchifolius TaxID=185202 RepID=A0ACB9C9J9_9ASTR|nr:hypothetical protein L1987_62111 [Smallanthus sonchifolius]
MIYHITWVFGHLRAKWSFVGIVILGHIWIEDNNVKFRFIYPVSLSKTLLLTISPNLYFLSPDDLHLHIHALILFRYHLTEIADRL